MKVTIQEVVAKLKDKGHNLTLANGHQATLSKGGYRVFTVVEDDGPELEIETTKEGGTPRCRYFSLRDPACYSLVDEFLRDEAPFLKS